VTLTRTTTTEGLEKGTFRASREEEVEGLDARHVSKLRQVRADEEWRAAQAKSSIVLKDGDAHWRIDGEIEASNANARLLMTPDGTRRSR
jgi:hypothetical protein